MGKKWWEEDAVVGQQDVMSAIGTKSATEDEGNWWEEDVAFRADTGAQAVLSSIEADKKRQDEQARLHEAHQSIERWGEVPTVASQIVMDTAAIGERVLGMGERADQVVRDSATLDQAMRERDAAQWRTEEDPEGMSTLEQVGQYIPWIKQGIRGAARSLGSAVLGAKGGGALLNTGKIATGAVRGAAAGAAVRGAAGVARGASQGAGGAARAALASPGSSAYGAIGLASTQETNRAITEGADAGLKGAALAGYVASQGIIEALPATVMQRLGLGGVEAMIAGPSIRGGIKAGFIEAIKATGQEIPEELATEVLHAVANEYSGVDTQALSGDSLSSLVADTVLQTVIMGAGAGALKTATGEAQARLARLQEIRAKGFVSAEEAKELGIVGKNRNERRANADAEIEQLSAIPPELPPEVTQATPPGTPPPLPGVPGAAAVPPTLPPPLPQGAANASQVPTNEGSPNAQGNGGEGSQVPVSSQVRGAGQDQGSSQPTRQEPAAQEVQVKPPRMRDDEPPVAEGMTRLYHGSATPGRTEGKAWFSTSRPYAENYRGKETSELQYVDVPTEMVNKNVDPDNYGQTVDKGFVWNVELDSSETGPRKIIAKPQAKPVDPVSELDQAEDEFGELAKTFDDEEETAPSTPVPPQEQKPASTKPVVQPAQSRDELIAKRDALQAEAKNELSIDRAFDLEDQVAALNKQINATPAVSEQDQAEDEFANLAKTFEEEEETPQTKPVEQPKPKAEKAQEPPSKPEWDVVKGGDGKLYREDPNAKTPSERIKTRQAIDPSEGAAVITKDQWGKPIPPETLKARQEFADKAKPGVEFEASNYKGQSFKVLDDGTLLNSSATNQGRKLGNVQDMVNTIVPGQITWKESPSTAAESQGTRATPTTEAPAAQTSNAAPPKPTETTTPPKQPESASAQPPTPPKLGTKGVIKPARKMEPTEEGRPVDGKPIIPGDRFVTNTGRETTPYPKYSGSSNRQSINADKKAQLWLIENAIAEAESRGDDFNLTTFKSELENARKGKLPQASKDSATLYVFGDYVPAVPKPILKPLIEKPSENSKNDTARTDKSSELDSKPVSQPEGVGSSATNTGAALPASEQARENLRKRGKKKPSQADIDAETSAVIREREADNKVRQEFQSDRDAQKAQDARREFVGKQKELANPATVDSLGFGDIAQVNDDIERGRVSYEDATKVADEFVAAGYLPQGKRDQIRKPTQPSADQVNVDSGEDSKVKPEDELASLRAKSEKMYDEVERLQNTGKDREANALLREAEKLTPRIKELEAPLIKAKQDAEVAAKEESRKAYNAKEDARKAALPTKQTRNGWELATDGARWYLRDPNTKEIIYEGKLKRVREVADESPPDVPASTEPPKSSVAPDKAKETTEAEAKPSESVPPLPWSNSSPEDESKWYGTKINVAPANRREEPYTGQVVRVLNRGEMVEVQPDGQDGTFRVDSARITLAEAAPTVADKPSVEPAAEPLPDPAIPAFTRTTPGKGSATRQFQSERVEKARKEIADLERKARAKRSEHDGLRSNATKKRAAVKKEIYAINNRIQVVQGEIASDFAADTLAKLEDELESPRSYDHYLAGMKAIHKLKASVAEDAARRGEMGREAARAEVSKEQNEADRLDAELQGRAKDIAMSKGFTPGDADQIALSASNGFTVFEDRSLADIVEVQGARTRESRVSQEINKLKPSSPYGQQDLSTEQIAEFTKQYQEASLDDKNWLDKRKEVDKSVREAIQANRDAVRKREDEERKAKEAEKAKDDQERLANARERAKKYFLDERISKALKKQKPKTKPVKLRQEKAGGPVKIVDGKITDGDQSGELYPNGLILHKSFEEGSKDFVLTHARSGSGFPFSAKKSDMQELIGIIDLLGIDFNVDTDEKGALPSELTARVKKINNAWDNNDYSLLSDEDYATVQTLAETAKTDIDADLILTADDLGANGIPPGLDNVMTDKGLRIVKEMAIAVPEFAYDPVFTVKDGKLLYRDGYEFKLEPTAFNLHPSELKEGQTVGINLEDLGIKRATPQDVVAAMMTGAGLPRVTKNKGGDVSVGYVGAKPTSLEQGKDDSEWNVVGGTPKVQEMAVAVLKKIRWRQPGQDGDPKTDIDVVPADQPQAADDASQNVPAIQSEEVPTIDPFSERSPESAERRKLIAEAKNEMRPYYQIEPEIGVEEGIRNAINSFVAGTSDNARIIGGADGKALGYDGSTKQWNAIIKRAQSIADKTNAVQAVVAVGDTETGVPTHAVIISSPGFVGATFESQNTKPFAWGNTIEKLYDGLPSQIVMPEVAKQSIDSSAQAEAKYGNTPLGKLFAEAKAAGGDTMLFFRMGDFYELYFEDAQKAAKMLGLTLTTRDKSAENPIPMTGFPYHQLDGYLKKLKSAGIRVAVNEEPFAKPQAKAKAEQKTEPESASVPTQAEFMEMSNGVNAPGVKQTIRVTAGERTLLMERSKHDGEWSIREAEKYTGEVKGKTAVKKGGELIVSGIVETKKAKEIAQRIIDGTFDKDTDNRFVREDTQNIGLTNAGIAEAMKGALGGKRDSFAKLLLEKGLVTDGRFLMKVSDKDRDAILKSVGETFEGRDLSVVSKMLDDGQKALSRAANAMKPIGYRGGYLTSRTVVLQSQDGDSAILDKALHDTILKKYPSAVPYFLEDGKPVSYAIDGELVAIVMPMNMNKPDSTVKELVSGKYDFDAAAAEAAKFPPPQSKTKLKQAAEKANKELANAVDEFGKAIKGKLGMNLPLNPEVIAAAAKVVSKAIQAGTLNFSELMERMVAKYGEKMAERMRSVLRQEWDKQINSNPIAEDGIPPKTPQPHPELVQPEPIPLTSVKNAIVDELRVQRGEAPMPEVTPETVPQWLELAGNRIANDPYAGNTLVEQLLSGDKTSVDEMEGMVLQYHYRAVNNLFEAADAKLTQAKANGDPAEIAIAQDEARVIMRRLSAIETALDKAGTAWGRAGVSRQMFLKQDFSLGSMVRRARVANGGAELSDAQVAIISEQADKIEKLQKQLAELEAKVEAKAAEQEQAKVIDEAIKKDVEETKKPPVAKPKSKIRLKAEARLASAWEKFGAVAKGKLYSNPIDPELIKPALEVVKAYVDLGIVTFREFMSTAVQNMGAKAAKASEPTFRAAWDQLKSDGELAQPALDITNVGQLTRFARQVQRTMVESGITEREAVVDGVHEALQEIIPEITRRQAMDALSSYGQFAQLSKDPVDQIIRDINGQLQQLAKLEDMEKGQAPAKTGVERRSPTDEERRLTQMVNEAKRRGGFVVTDPETQLKSAMAAAKTAVRNRIADMNYEIKTGSRVVRNKTELIPDAELEQLRKDRDELQKVHKEMFPPKGVTEAQKIASANRALDAAIASLEAKLAVGDVSPAPQPAPLSTPELDAKRARLKDLHDQRNALRKTDEQTKVRALDRSIAAIEKEIAAGDFTLKPKPAPLTSPEINARLAKLEELLATKRSLVAAANPDMAAQRASRAYEAHLRKQLAMYLEKIAQGDFSPKPKKQPRVLTKGELDLKKQLADVKHDFFEALAKYHLENLSPGERAIDIVRESAHLSRAIMTSIDLSAILRQGGLGVYSHPAIARKAAAEMWGAIWSREKEFQSVEKLRTRPNAQLYEESGLNITDSEGKLTRQEEAFMGRWARTGIDFLGKRFQAGSKVALEPVAASSRAYVTFINNLRADLFDVMVENLGQGGQVTKEEARLIAKYVNVATGRSDLKSLNNAAATLNTVFFAPRYVASRFQYLAMPFYLIGTKDSARVKKLIAKEYARTFTGAAVFIGSLTALAYLVAGDDEEEKPSVEFSPLSADFGKVRINETRLDPLAGLAQVIVFSSRMAAWRTKSSVNGKIKPFYEGGPYETTHASEAGRFIRTKLAPVPGAAVTAFYGMKDVVGETVTPAGLVGGLFVPISVGEVYSTMRHRGIPKGTALAVLNSMGASVNTYGPKTAYLDATPEDRAKQVKDYIKNMNWESDLPAFSPYLKPEELKQVQERQNERRGDLVYEAMGKVMPKNEYKTEAHFEEAQERYEKVNKEFEEFRKQYAPTFADAVRYLNHHFDDEGGIRIKGSGGKKKPSFKERYNALVRRYQ